MSEKISSITKKWNIHHFREFVVSRKGLVGKNHRKRLRTIKSSLQTTSFFIYADSNQDIYFFFTIKTKTKAKTKTYSVASRVIPLTSILLENEIRLIGLWTIITAAADIYQRYQANINTEQQLDGLVEGCSCVKEK